MPQEITKITKEICNCTILDDREAKQVIEAICHWPILSIKSSIMQYGLKECPIKLDNLKAEPIPLGPSKQYKLRLSIEMLGPNKVSFSSYFFLFMVKDSGVPEFFGYLLSRRSAPKLGSW